MLVYKWVIKYNKKYYTIINNGAYRPFDNLNLSYYKKGKTIKKFINPYNLVSKEKIHKQRGFHRTGFHFWVDKKGERLEQYQKYMARRGKKINCTLKCYIRDKDILMKDSKRVIAKKFRILGEEDG